MRRNQVSFIDLVTTDDILPLDYRLRRNDLQPGIECTGQKRVGAEYMSFDNGETRMETLRSLPLAHLAFAGRYGNWVNWGHSNREKGRMVDG